MPIDWFDGFLVAGGVGLGALVLWATGHAITILRAEAREARRARIDDARHHPT